MKIQRDPYLYVFAISEESARRFFGFNEGWPCRRMPWQEGDPTDGRLRYELPTQETRREVTP